MRVSVASSALAIGTAIMVAGGPTATSDVLPGPVPARVVGVTDGDTIVVRARIWLFQDIETRVRIKGVDAPELKSRCADERRLATAARDFVAERTADRDVVLTDIHYGKYAGRVVARVTTADGRDLAQALVGAGLARPYDGGRRASWCPAGPSRDAAPG